MTLRNSQMPESTIAEESGWYRNEGGLGHKEAFTSADLIHLDPALMVPGLHSHDRMGAIKELVDRFHRAGWVTDSLSFLQSVLDQEDLESTVIGKGVAFPHARCRSVTRLGVAFGISRQGVAFYSNDYPERVHLICMLAVPMSGAVKYLSLLGDLAGLFHNYGFRSGLLGCHSAKEMHMLLAQSIPGEANRFSGSSD